MEKAYSEKMKSRLDALAQTGRLSKKAVFIFGHCHASEVLIGCLRERGVAAAAILDNNAAKQGCVYRGVRVAAPGLIQSFAGADSVVLIAGRHGAQMTAQLRRMGYGGDVINVADYNAFADYSLDGDVFNARLRRVRRGVKTLAALRKRFASRHLVICPHDALGDVYWAMAYLPAYCEKNGVRDTAVVVAGDACAQVAGLFRDGGVRVVSSTEMDELVQAVLFTREKNCTVAHHDRPYTDNIIGFLNSRFLSFVDYYKYAVYGLDSSAKAARPVFTAQPESFAPLVKGRTVILSPYAKSVAAPPDGYWETLADGYVREGWTVLTNVAKDEAPVGGTQPLSLPVSQMIAAAEYAGCFIGLRSGLCDVLAAANCRKVMVFPDCCYSTTPVKVDAFFGLPGWEKTVVKADAR